MNGVEFLDTLDAQRPMPMAEHWGFHIVAFERGAVTATATPSASYENPFGVVQGGFAATVLDIALGLVSISILDDTAEQMVGTTDLVVRYFAPIKGETGPMNVRAKVTYVSDRQVVAEAMLEDAAGTQYAYAQSNCVISRRK
jgi:uncharacterized protein (TIGR00369 family)